MEIVSSTADAGMRLMQALEESRMPQGQTLVGSGNRPAVPPEVAQEFRTLMEAPAGQTTSNAPAQTNLDTLSQAQTESGLPPPVELLQTQMHVGMIAFESKFLSETRSQVAQSMEQQLKSNS